MKIKTFIIVFIIPIVVFSGVLIFLNFQKSNKEIMDNQSESIQLPKPSYQGNLFVEEAINQRRSIREYQDKSLTLTEVSQLLWAAQGLNVKGGRVAPSAGALYPMEIYLVVKDVENLSPAVYHYLNKSHSLELYSESQIDSELAEASYSQSWVEKAPVKIIISGIFERTTSKYGERGIQFVYQESGHIAQNVYLQAESLDLGTVVVGGFNQGKIDKLFNFNEWQQVLYIMPVGWK